MKENNPFHEIIPDDDDKNNSLTKPIIEELIERSQSNLSKSKPVYSQKRIIKNQNFIKKKSVSFHSDIVKTIDVESYKLHNLKMTYDEVDMLTGGIPSNKKCCDDLNCILY